MAKIKVLMIGGKRCGKTTVLAKIRRNFNDVLHHGVNEGNDLFTLVTPPDQIAHLNAAEDCIINYFSGPDVDPYSKFVINDNPTTQPSSTRFSLRSLGKGLNNERVEVEFTDIPGEWCNDNTEVVTNLIQESQAIIIAIDTPSLCEEEGFYAELCNRIRIIKEMMKTAIVDSGFLAEELSQKLILFVPLKCEKEIISSNGEVDTAGMLRINEKVKFFYRDLIGLLSQGSCRDKITMAILPISTIKEIRWIQYKGMVDGKEVSLYTEQGMRRVFDYGDNTKYLASYYQFRPNLLERALKYGPGSEFCEQPLVYILVYTMQYSLHQRNNNLTFEGKPFFKKISAALKNTWKGITNAFVNNDDLKEELTRLKVKKMKRSNGVEILQNPLNI